jgi:sugar phosphate isomerase/epimerase
VTVQLGVSSSCFREVSLPECLRWAGAAGFQTVEINAPPMSVRAGGSWFQHSSLNVLALDGAARDALVSALDKSGLRAAALAWQGHLLEPDADRAAAAQAHLGRVVEAAAMLGIGVVTTCVGRMPGATLGDSIAEFARRVAPALEQAESSQVRLALSTSPMIGRQSEDVPGNSAFCPELWEKIFTHVRSEALGLALSPADLAWTGVDPVAAVTDYAEKVFLIYALDVEMLDLRRQDCGLLRPGGGWWRHRLPGLGVIDWRRLIDRLHELQFAGSLVIPQEDHVWQGSLDKVKTGLALARRHLVQFLP